jgi:hypothetical protein
MKRNIFKIFNDNFFRSEKNITWYDTQGVMKLDDNRVVTFTIDDVGTRGDYNGYWVEIVNKQNGTIIKRFFRFIDLLDMIHRDNSDKYHHVWLCRGELDWYISRPKNSKQMVDTIMDWINMFK